MASLRAPPDPTRATITLLAALPAASLRQALLTERLSHVDAPCAASLLEALLTTAARCDPLAWPATMTLFRWRRDHHRIPDNDLAAIARAAATSGLAATHAFCDDAPAHRALHRLGRLAEVCTPERRDIEYDQFWRINMLLRWTPRLLLHPSPVMVTLLLEQSWVKLRDVLVIASRRPSSPAIAFAVADSERWIAHPVVREALVLNPFTPTGLALALLPTAGPRALAHLRDGGDVHPKLAHAARCFVALRHATPPAPSSPPPVAPPSAA